MKKRNITLLNPERFMGEHTIPKDKLDTAIKKACDKLASKIDLYLDDFPATASKEYKYPLGENNNWVCGLHTGTFLLAYELTGDKKFLDVAKHHMASYRRRIDEKINLADHDVGFVFSPASVAYYKLTGDNEAKSISLDAAKHLYNTGYSKKGGFILRSGPRADQSWACRTMMDSLLNAPLLFWAGKEFNIPEYTEAALSQSVITEKYLIRDDASTFHHYQFEVGTHKPLHGLTLQGLSNDSCWSRGHAWGIYGLPIAYSYTGEKWLIDTHRDITYFMLNHLPCDNLPYWDYDFISGDEARDSSAGAINACGLMEMIKYLPDDCKDKEIFKNAAAMMLESVIDNCTGDIGIEYDGLVHKVTGGKPQGMAVNECCLYGDYYYLEALLRYTKPEWKMYW